MIAQGRYDMVVSDHPETETTRQLDEPDPDGFRLQDEPGYCDGRSCRRLSR